MVEYQKATNSRQQMKTIEDMQNFVESFSDFSAAQRNAGKHVTLMSELNAAVVARNLMSVSSVSVPQPLALMLPAPMQCAAGAFCNVVHRQASDRSASN